VTLLSGWPTDARRSAAAENDIGLKRRAAALTELRQQSAAE
jgi:hypothetical protein